MGTIKEYFPELVKMVSNNYFDFLKLIITKGIYNPDEINKIQLAYNEARKLHQGTFRISGEAYIMHPLNVAYILAERGFDCDTIVAALLHDTVEDTNYKLSDVKEKFGNEVAILVDGVTKLKRSDFNSKEESKIETQRKIIQGVTHDARIIAIKLADRLHNMITLESMPEEKRILISNETIHFYVPFARTLGTYKMKDELQDLSLFFLDNSSFLEFYDKRKNIKNINVNESKCIGNEVKENLKEYNINMSYNYKVKNVAGIFEEVKSGTEIKDIKDLIAIRMIVNKISDCYKALEVANKIYGSIDNSTIDLIKHPKYNGYRSLNTNLKLLSRYELQLRIRTNKMQRINELGVVSNWNPKTQELVNKMCMDLIKLDKENLPAKEYVEETERVFFKKRGE